MVKRSGVGICLRPRRDLPGRGLHDAMDRALPDTPSGRRQLQRLRDSPTEPVALGVSGTDHDRLLRHGSTAGRTGGLALGRYETSRDRRRHACRRSLISSTFGHRWCLHVDGRGRHDFCNDSFAATLGYEPGKLCGTHIPEVLGPVNSEPTGGRRRRVESRLRGRQRPST